jgi:hypothetical protein
MDFVTYRAQRNALHPLVTETPKADYVEHLLDGLYVFHNPYAKMPLARSFFHHDRVAQYIPDSSGALEVIGPDDFLLLRHLVSRDESGAKAVLEALRERERRDSTGALP